MQEGYISYSSTELHIEYSVDKQATYNIWCQKTTFGCLFLFPFFDAHKHMRTGHPGLVVSFQAASFLLFNSERKCIRGLSELDRA